MNRPHHHYDAANDLLILLNIASKDFDCLMAGKALDIEVDNKNAMQVFAYKHTNSGTASCQIDGKIFMVHVWVEAPHCDCCQEWEGFWHAQLALDSHGTFC